MARIARWHTSWRWAVAVGWLVCHLTAVSAQDGRWEHRTARGAQAFAQGDYAEAARQFQAALPLADVGSLAPSCMHLAAVYEAQGQYTEAALLYRRALVLQEQIVGPDHPQLVDVLEAAAALQRKMHPVQSLLPWSSAITGCKFSVVQMLWSSAQIEGNRIRRERCAEKNAWDSEPA